MDPERTSPNGLNSPPGDTRDNAEYRINSPAVVASVIYVTTGDTDAYQQIARAINASTGETIWTVGSPDAAYVGGSSPTVGPEHIYFGGQTLNTHYVYAVDRETGEVVWKYERVGSVIPSTPIPVDGTEYIRTADAHNQDYMYALNATTCTSTGQWKLPSDADGKRRHPEVTRMQHNPGHAVHSGSVSIRFIARQLPVCRVSLLA